MLRVPPPFLALAALLAQRALSAKKPSPGPARVVATAGIAIPSVVLAASAASQFRRRGTTIDALHPDAVSTLVTAGPFAVTRNPMYVGLSGLLVAHALWHRSWLALVPVAGFVAAIDRLQVPAEEAALARKFGVAYDEYRHATPRWLDQRSLAVGGR